MSIKVSKDSANYLKTLKFKDHLIPAILDGSKVTTWRLFDDKNLQAGDKLTFVSVESGKSFAKADIVKVKQKRLEQIRKSDLEKGREIYSSSEDMIESFRSHYGDVVNLDTTVKIIEFKLTKNLHE